MSDSSVNPARPVSLFTLVLLLGVFSAFLLVVRYYYQPAPLAAYNAAPENLPKELEWRATSEARRKTLASMDWAPRNGALIAAQLCLRGLFPFN